MSLELRFSTRDGVTTVVATAAGRTDPAHQVTTCFEQDTWSCLRAYLSTAHLRADSGWRARGEEQFRQVTVRASELWRAVAGPVARQWAEQVDLDGAPRIDLVAQDPASLAALGLPWELLPIRGQHLGRSDAIITRRLALRSSQPSCPPPGRKLRILVAVARPSDRDDLDLFHSWRGVFRIQQEHPDVEVLFEPSGTLEGLLQRVDREHGLGGVDLVRLDGHGTSGSGGTVCFEFEGKDGRAEPCATSRLAQELVHRGLRWLVLDACHTAGEAGGPDALAELAATGLAGVVGMAGPVHVDAARSFREVFYLALAKGRTFAHAVSRARRFLAQDPARQVSIGGEQVGVQDWAVPRVALSVQDGALLRADRASSTTPQLPFVNDIPPPPDTGMFGRDRRVLEGLRLLQDDQLAIVVGMAGIGKTTVAREVAALAALARLYPDGVFFIRLAGEGEAAAFEQLVGLVALRIGKADSRAMRDFLATGHYLVVFDDVDRMAGGRRWSSTRHQQVWGLVDMVRGGNGAVLISLSDHPNVPDRYDQYVPLTGLRAGAARALFAAASGRTVPAEGTTELALDPVLGHPGTLRWLAGNPPPLDRFAVVEHLATATLDSAIRTRLEQAVTMLSPAARAHLPSLSLVLPRTDRLTAERVLELDEDEWIALCRDLSRCGLAEVGSGGPVLKAHPLLARVLEGPAPPEAVARAVGSMSRIYAMADDPEDSLAKRLGLFTVVNQYTVPGLLRTAVGLGQVQPSLELLRLYRRHLERFDDTRAADALEWDIQQRLPQRAHGKDLTVHARVRALSDAGRHVEALELLREVLHDPTSTPAACAQAMVDTAHIGLRLSSADPVLLASICELLNDAIDHCDDADDLVGLWQARYARATVWRRQGRLHEARAELEEIEAAIHARADFRLHGAVRLALGNVCLDLGEVEAARGHYTAALGPFRRTQQWAGVTRAMLGLGDLEASVAAAAAWWSDAHQLAVEHGLDDIRSVLARRLGGADPDPPSG